MEDLAYALQLIEDVDPQPHRAQEIRLLDSLYKDLKEMKRRGRNVADGKPFVSRYELLNVMVSHYSQLFYH